MNEKITRMLGVVMAEQKVMQRTIALLLAGQPNGRSEEEFQRAATAVQELQDGWRRQEFRQVWLDLRLPGPVPTFETHDDEPLPEGDPN